MSLAGRRRRLLRVRQIDQRAATALLAKSDMARRHVVAISERVAGLRDAIGYPVGNHDGRTLQSLAELEARLEQAGFNLVRATDEAAQRHAADRTEWQAAERSVAQAERLVDKAARDEERSREYRLASAQAHRAKRGKPAC